MKYDMQFQWHNYYVPCIILVSSHSLPLMYWFIHDFFFCQFCCLININNATGGLLTCIYIKCTFLIFWFNLFPHHFICTGLLSLLNYLLYKHFNHEVYLFTCTAKHVSMLCTYAVIEKQTTVSLIALVLYWIEFELCTK